MRVKCIMLVSILFIGTQLYGQTIASAPKSTFQKFSSVELLQDAEILKDVLKKIHPGLLSHMSMSEFEEGYQRLLDSLKRPLTEWEFHKQVLDFVADVRCGHTEVLFSERTEGYLKTFRFFPFGIKMLDSTVYISKNFTKVSDAEPGAQILSINNIPAQEVVRRLAPYSWADGFYHAPDVVETDFEVKYALVFGTPDTFKVQLKTRKGETVFSNAPAMTHKEMSEIERVKYPDRFTPWTFEYDSGSNTAILGNIVFEGKGYKRFLEKSFKKIGELGATNLIIDLRDNGGGEDEYPLWLFQYIAEKPFKYYEKIEAREISPDDTIFKYLSGTRYFLNAVRSDHVNKTGTGYCSLKNSMHYNLREVFDPKPGSFKGRVYLIVNSNSFSASCEFAAVASYNKRCAVIGEETMGGYCMNNSGYEFLLTLPKTGTKVLIPAYRYISACKDCPNGRGIIPDHPVFPDPPDFTKGDAVLEFTLNLIKQANKN